MTPDDFQDHVIDTLARLDTKMDTLVGPDGRIPKLETDVESLKKARWTIGGIVTTVSVLGGEAVRLLFHHK